MKILYTFLEQNINFAEGYIKAEHKEYGYKKN